MPFPARRPVALACELPEREIDFLIYQGYRCKSDEDAQLILTMYPDHEYLDAKKSVMEDQALLMEFFGALIVRFNNRVNRLDANLAYAVDNNLYFLNANGIVFIHEAPGVGIPDFLRTGSTPVNFPALIREDAREKVA